MIQDSNKTVEASRLVKILAVSDQVIPFIYNPTIRQRFSDVSLVVSCGDLPDYYLEYILSMLDVPLFYVHGNHDYRDERRHARDTQAPAGGINLHQRFINHRGLLMAGVEGSVRYREGPYQYSQMEMWTHVFRLIPSMLRNRIAYGRYLDIFISHSPPSEIHDKPDLPHQGVKAFRWLIEVFHPSIHFHGHVHVYRPDEATETLQGRTRIINCYGYREASLDCGQIPDKEEANINKMQRSAAD